MRTIPWDYLSHVNVKSYTYQYFSRSYKILFISSSSLATSSSINLNCQYSILQMADLQTFKIWLATAHILIGIKIAFMNLESILKIRSTTYTLLAAAFTSYQVNYIFRITIYSTCCFVLAFISTSSKFSRNYQKILTNISSATLFNWTSILFYTFREQRSTYEFL